MARTNTQGTQASIISVILAQEIKALDEKVKATPFLSLEDAGTGHAGRRLTDPRREAVAARNAVIAVKSKVDRYLRGDLSVLVR